MIEEGALVFYHDPEVSWTLGTVSSWDGKKAEVKGRDGGGMSGVMDEQMTIAREDTIDEQKDDLMDLTLLHDATILRSLKLRYMQDIIYTNIGPIVVALNPFNFKIPWYGDDNIPKYLAEGDRIENNLPHSWAVAHNTYHEMMNDSQNQCILVSGESGAGKTEASKIVMKYLAALSTKGGGPAQKEAGSNVGRKINMTSPPLETWGNAKTVRNDNSSRFGKFMKVKFDYEGNLLGAFVIKYLLEKSRIVTAGPGERCYHSFYLAVRSKDASQHQLGADSEYKSITSGNCVTNKEFDTAEEYDEVCLALSEIGTSQETITSMWKVVAGILHLQNVEFLPEGEGSKINPSSDKDIDKVVATWGCDKAVLTKELCVTTLNIQGSDVERLLPPVKAADCRDSLSKHMYDNEFSKLIEQCNLLLDTGGDGNWIGLLDIFGFEDFEVNSFEQICINLANESLQHHYNTYIFQRDMDECRAEGIDVTSVVFPDNTPCLNMVAAKGGVMSLLDEECSLGSGTDDAFLSKVIEHHSSNEFFAIKKLSKESFIIKHYAKDVNYTVPGFLEKNRDTLKDAFKMMMRGVSDAYMKGMVTDIQLQQFAELLPAPNPEAKGAKVTVGGFYKQQLKDLMDLINSTNPHWIRCIKPHPAKKPLHFDGVSTLAQLSSSGVLGTVRIRKAGFPVRIIHDDFFFKYKVIAPGEPQCRETCQKILDRASLPKEKAQMGKTKVFMKQEAFLEVEKLKKELLQDSARVVQAWMRGLVALGDVRKTILAANKEAMDKMREQVRGEMEEQRRIAAADAAANADRLAAEAKALEEAELAERMAKASETLIADEEVARKAIEDEEASCISSMIAQEEAAREELKVATQKWQLGKEEEAARNEIEREEEEDGFEFLSLGTELQQRMQLESLKYEAEAMLAKNREERARKDAERRERNREQDRSLPERLAVPNEVVNTAAHSELEAAQQMRIRQSLEDKIISEASSPAGSPMGSLVGSFPGSPLSVPQVTSVIPAGTQRMPDGTLNTTPLDVWNTHPTSASIGETLYVAARHAFGVVVDHEPGNGHQFRVSFSDGSFMWCDTSDACTVSEGYVNIRLVTYPRRSNSFSPTGPSPRSFPTSSSLPSPVCSAKRRKCQQEPKSASPTRRSKWGAS